MMQKELVFLFDVDNTLLDNDRVTADLKRQLEREIGHERQERYWSIFEELRAELGYGDYLGDGLLRSSCGKVIMRWTRE